MGNFIKFLNVGLLVLVTYAYGMQRTLVGDMLYLLDKCGNSRIYPVLTTSGYNTLQAPPHSLHRPRITDDDFQASVHALNKIDTTVFRPAPSVRGTVPYPYIMVGHFLRLVEKGEDPDTLAQRVITLFERNPLDLITTGHLFMNYSTPHHIYTLSHCALSAPEDYIRQYVQHIPKAYFTEDDFIGTLRFTPRDIEASHLHSHNAIPETLTRYFFTYHTVAKILRAAPKMSAGQI